MIPNQMPPDVSTNSGQLESPLQIGIQDLMGHLATAEYPEDQPVLPVAHRITPPQRSYIALRVRGFSSAAACRKLGINQLAALRWTKAEWFEPACEEERIKWLTSTGIDKQDVIAPLVHDAIQVVHSTLRSEDEKLRFAAANRVIDIFFDEVGKRPVGRPRSAEAINDMADKALLDLSEIQQRANEKVNELRANGSPSYDLRANAQ